MNFNPNKLLQKPVYDVSNYGHDLSINLGMDTGLTLTDITPSTASFNQTSPSSTVFDMEHFDTIISNLDTLPIAHEGNNTAFNRIYQWIPDMSAFVYKFNFIAAFGLNVSAYTSGNFDIQSVRLILTEHLPDGTQVGQPIVDQTFTATLTALTATGTQIFIMNIENTHSFKVSQANPIRLQIIVNEETGTGTRQVGIMPIFCFNSAATNKIFTTSQLLLHVHASLDHAFPVFRDQSAQEQLDYSGVDFENFKRGAPFQ